MIPNLRKWNFVQNLAKIMQNCAAEVKMIQKRASQGFLDPIQKRALSRSVLLEAVYLEALLYILNSSCHFCVNFSGVWNMKKVFRNNNHFFRLYSQLKAYFSLRNFGFKRGKNVGCSQGFFPCKFPKLLILESRLMSVAKQKGQKRGK